MMKKARFLGISLLAVLAMFAVACSSEEEPTSTPIPEPTATQVPTVVSTPPPARSERPTPTGQAKVAPELLQTPERVGDDKPTGGVFRRLWADPPTLDPALVTDGTSYAIVIELFSGLVKLTGESDDPIAMDLAESYSVSNEGKTYKFVLKEDLKFSDGSPLTASDFKWSWERAALPETESPIVDEFLGDIIGVQAIIDGEATTAEGIEVIDDHTLQVTIDAPKPYFIAKLTYPIAFVVNADNVTSGGENWTDDPVGTGPFVLKSYSIGERMILSKNPNYWGDPAYLDEVHMLLAGGSAMAMYENDEIDITGIGLADLERVTDPEEELSKDVVEVPPSFSTSYIGFNVEEAPFDDVHFRRALNFAVDKQLVANAVFSDLVRPATGVIPPGFVGFNPDLEGLAFDEEKAKEELAKSKYADPETRPRIVITLPGTGGSPSLTTEVVADMWRRTLEVDVEIQQVEWATFLQDLHRNRLQAFSLAWQADYPDPHTFVDVLFRTGSSINNTNYSNPEVDALLEQANIEADPVRRIKLYQEAEEMIVEDAAWLPLWWGVEGKVLVKQRVGGMTFPPLSVPIYQYVYIDG
ncbi:MAG: peptide ABC transporter substrate-binding protein [Chloroflexi bacterium]|nr:peptide ABC transporter substrate-binding protein [Chloroflexota bacterium]